LKRYKRSGKKNYSVEVDKQQTREMLETLPDWAGLEVKTGEEGYRVELIGKGGEIIRSVRGSKGGFSLKKLDTYARVRVVLTRKRADRRLEEFYAWGQPVFVED